MSDDDLVRFSFPAVQRKKITAAFDGGRVTFDGGVMLLAQAERRLGIAGQFAQVIPDRRDQDRVTHLLPDILRARIFAIACGYEDADDLDRCAVTRPSSSPAGGCPTAGPICARNRPSRGGRTARVARPGPADGVGRSLLRQGGLSFKKCFGRLPGDLVLAGCLSGG